MEEFSPLLVLLFFWICIGLPLSIAKKSADQKKMSRPAPRQTSPGESSPAAQTPAEPARLTTLTSTLSEPDHDDSVYTGSLGAFSTEGFDPCHDEQMSSLELVCQPGKEETPAPKAAAGLPLGWTDNDVVRGIVMSEILNRKRA